jgi:BolA protein
VSGAPAAGAPDNTARLARMRGLLEAALAPLALELSDDSHRHVGHEGARDGRGHFSVRVVSAAFRGQPPLARHRLVYAALGDMMHTDIHALAIQALAPEDAQRDA